MEKKKRILEMEFEIARQAKRADIVGECIDNTIADNIKNSFILMKRKEELLNQIYSPYTKEFKNFDSDLIDILEHKKGESIQFGTNLIPPNIYKLETFLSWHEYKNRIKFAIYKKLYALKETDENGKILDIWDKSTLIIEIFKEGRNTDFDNYFMKPYVDGIVMSRFINDDSAKNLNLIYAPLDLKDYVIKFTLINQNHLAKYKDFIFDVLNK